MSEFSLLKELINEVDGLNEDVFKVKDIKNISEVKSKISEGKCGGAKENEEEGYRICAGEMTFSEDAGMRLVDDIVKDFVDNKIQCKDKNIEEALQAAFEELDIYDIKDECIEFLKQEIKSKVQAAKEATKKSK